MVEFLASCLRLLASKAALIHLVFQKLTYKTPMIDTTYT